MIKIIKFIVLAVLVAFTSACAIEPWVKPYERDNLADPIMAFSRDPVQLNYMHHVYQSREAARGAEGGGSGGCGCN
ncbi:MAG: DUF4266 domain-containing protein [Kangiellaceae bacterium]|nr:DUF4266 domain-containing protein [Kangiellaceae bacterium]